MRKTATEERKDDTEDDTHKELYLRGLEAQANEQREIAIGSFERYVERTAQGGVIDLKAARILANLHLKAARQSTDKERQEEHIAKAREANQRVIRALAAEEQGRFPAARTSLLRATARVQEAWIYDLADRLGLAPDASGVSYGRLAQRDLDEAFTISKIQGNAHLGGIIRTTEAVMARQRNDLELASQKAREAVGILTGAQTAENDKGKREGGVGALAMALDTLAAIQTEQLKLAQAEESSVRALALYDELGNTRDSLQANYNYGTLLVQRGSIEKAERIFLKGIRAARAARDEYHEALFLSARGDIFAFREENGLAAASYLEALGRFADKRDFQQYYALTQGTLMLVRTGKVKEARALIIAPCEERFGCDQYNKGLLLEARAMLAAATGERAMLERAIEEIEKEGAAMSVQSAGVAARMYAAASRAALRLGDARRSQSYRAKAEETLRSDVSAFDRSAARATLHGK